MLPGPTYVYKCPNCGNLLTTESLRSGNTFRQQIYSDGKSISPMLPEFPDLTKCKKCNTFIWLSKLQETNTFERGDFKNPSGQDADKAEFLTIDEYYSALNTIINDRVEELFVRQRIWWAYNDKTRDNQNIFIDKDDESSWKENCEKLMLLLDPSDINQKIIIAEINRNLGNFEECVHIIQSIKTKELNWLKDIFLSECKKKNKLVVGLN